MLFVETLYDVFKRLSPELVLKIEQDVSFDYLSRVLHGIKTFEILNNIVLDFVQVLEHLLEFIPERAYYHERLELLFPLDDMFIGNINLLSVNITKVTNDVRTFIKEKYPKFTESIITQIKYSYGDCQLLRNYLTEASPCSNVFKSFGELWGQRYLVQLKPYLLSNITEFTWGAPICIGRCLTITPTFRHVTSPPVYSIVLAASAKIIVT